MLDFTYCSWNFLDGEAAFDSIDHNAMMVEVKRSGLSQSSLNLIQTLFMDASLLPEGFGYSRRMPITFPLYSDLLS